MATRLATTAMLALVLAFGCARARRQASVAAAAKPGPGVFFVATNGDDSWSGALPAPNARRTNGPVATFSRALQVVRELKRTETGRLPRAPTLFVRDGTWFLREPLALNPEDSGIVIAAYPGERPVISGGRRIDGWKEVTVGDKKLWTAEVPEVRERKWIFRELWINGERRTRARHPNKGYFDIAELPDKTPEWTRGQTRFRFREGDLKAWPSVTNAEVVVMTRWVESRLPVLGVDEKERLVSFGKRSVFQLAPGDVYYVEGAFELLDAPGEWYLDPQSGTLFYFPTPGETPDGIEAIAPVLTQIVRLEGRPEAAQFVEQVTFRGLTFAHAEWSLPKAGANDAPSRWPAPPSEVGGFNQAAIGVPGAVWGEGVRGCTFEDCVFSHAGTYGLELARGCQSNRIARCEFFDLGGGGLKIGEMAIRTNALEQAGANKISDCRIHDGGKMFHSAVGIWIGQSPDNRITHNLIHDFYYTGISIGWTWGYGRALATNNTVEFNHVHHIGMKSDGDGPILSDMGGIYTLGRQPGTRVINNLWHDIAALRYGGWGIYFDEGSSSIVAVSNVVFDTTHGGFHQHYGATNLVVNNIFANARDHQLQRTRDETHVSFTFSNNIVVFDRGVLLGGSWKNDNFVMDANVYWDARSSTKPDDMKFAGATVEQWHARGHDQHSLIVDPLFVSVQPDDYRLKPNSPALQLGFHPIDLRGVGPRR